MPSHNRHLARLATVVCALALFAAGIVTITCRDTSHPPERVATIATPINPTALSALVAPTVMATTTTEPPPIVPTPAKQFVPRHTPASSSADVDAAIARYFGDVLDQARAVVECESTFNPTAVSPDDKNWGLFQINIVHKNDFEQFTGRLWADAILTADANAAYARKLYDDLGWGPWSCRP